MTFRFQRRVGALAFAAALAVGACGGASTAPSGGTAISGQIIVSGSSTVEPITALVAELFNERISGDVAIEVTGPGTSDGFERFCAGETDISDASRSIRDEEIETCAEGGITEIIEIKVAIDGLSIITSVDNAIECLTFADLYALLGPESQGFDSWSDAQALATELGSATQLPDAPLEITAPGEESGTFGSFVEIVIETFNEDRGQDATTRPDYTASGNDNVIVEGISSFPSSLGWVGYAFAKENESRVKLLQVDDGESGCIAPTPETISSNEYPISRDLFIYVNKAKADENPAVAAFVDFYLADGLISEVLEEVPYVPLDPAALAESQAAWTDRATLGE
ncbi:MAG TPA: substrate-binding domain-containing protein [Candidatus Limnocylindrales bacterium]|nr:substrate-binding domain-containing protein [Candidatus Limnocylindrales bacterium]